MHQCRLYEAYLSQMIGRFYVKVQADAILGPIFEEHIKG
jgi:truncated hemoglobin YjbI